jgi:CubicO group peptidase (beta-lactamase class C family)
MKKWLIAFALTTCITVASAQSWADTVAKIEQAFARYKPANPGAMLAISRNNEVIFSKAWGIADLEHAIPLTTTSPCEAGSVSKQFTAAAILLLEQQGKLSLNDDIRKYFPELPNYGHTITLQHMLHHTSGLKDWGSLFALTGWPRQSRTYSNEDAAHIVSLQKSLNFKPGNEYSYSNSNYVLFALLVQKASGQSLEDFTKKYFFEPAGMTHTQWRSNFMKVVPGRAFAYAKEGQEYFTDLPNEYVYGAGGLLTTAEDLLAWNRFYLNGKLFTPSLLSKQLECTPLNNGRKNNYAAGLIIDSINGWPVIEHNGATASYRCNLQHLVAQNISIAFLSNTSEFDASPFNLAQAIVTIFAPDNRQPVVKNNITPFTLSAEKQAAYAGWYRNERDGASLKLWMADGKLRGRNSILTPLSATTFAASTGNTIDFFSPQKLRVITPGGDSILFTAMDSSSTNKTNQKEFTGNYYSDEVMAYAELVEKDGKLVFKQRPSTEIPLTPSYKDGFDTPQGPVYFERDKKGKLFLFKISVSRARNVVFKKVK